MDRKRAKAVTLLACMRELSGLMFCIGFLSPSMRMSRLYFETGNCNLSPSEFQFFCHYSVTASPNTNWVNV